MQILLKAGLMLNVKQPGHAAPWWLESEVPNPQTGNHYQLMWYQVIDRKYTQ